MSVKDINIKSHIYYFLNDIINIKYFDLGYVKINEKSYKNILIYYYIWYVTIKKELKIYSVNSLYLILRDVKEYFEEINENNYLTLVPTNESREKIKKYEELWIKIRELIKPITKNSNGYDKNIWKLNLIEMIIYF